MGYPVIVVREPDRTPIFLSIRNPLEIGRECAGLRVDDPIVSRRHIEVTNVEGSLIVTDLGSSNGTTIDGKPLTMPMRLDEGSVVRLGEVTVELVVDADRSRMTLAPSRSDGAVSDPKATLQPGAVSLPSTADPRHRASSVGGRIRPVGGIDNAARMTTIEMIASSVTSDEVSAVSSLASQGTLTIVFSDIESSTERNVALGDQVWFEVLRSHNTIVRTELKRYGGTEIKNQGDGFMLSFPSARRALQCVIGVQQELTAAEARDPERSVRIRVGMHTGEVMVEDGDLFGTHVVIAARVANLAEGQEILVSALTRDLVASRGDVVFGPAREAELKGIGTQLVYPVDWSKRLTD